MNKSFETLTSDSNDDETADTPKQPSSAPNPADNTPSPALLIPAPPAPPSSTFPHPVPGCPLWEWHALQCFNPSGFGAHGHRNEAISNAYEDLLNGIPMAHLVTSKLKDVVEFILDEAHITNLIVTEDTNLLDAPTFHEAMAGPECDKWHQAVLDELTAIKEAGTWELVDPPPNVQNIVGCCFILLRKCGAGGRVSRYKARLVAQGFSQHKGIDYSKTFTPVIKSTSLRVFLAICAWHSWRIHQMDIKSAYLNGTITEDIYMWQPKGYKEKGSEDKIAKLKKGLYGLKQMG